MMMTICMTMVMCMCICVCMGVCVCEHLHEHLHVCDCEPVESVVARGSVRVSGRDVAWSIMRGPYAAVICDGE